MSTDLTTTRPAQLTLPIPLAQAARAADQAAGKKLFDRYRTRLADETRRRHDADLACFAAYLAAAHTPPAGDLAAEPPAWTGLSWGIVAGFVEWQLKEGYAVGSINVRLSTVKTYAALATRAGSLDPAAYALIKLVPGFRHAEGRRVDRGRAQTRKGHKKAEPVSISSEQIDLLKGQADPRDQLLMCLLLDHGLRVGEVAALVTADFDLRRGVLRFYRQKVGKHQIHRLTEATLAAAEEVLEGCTKNDTLFGVDRTIRSRVKLLGERIGLIGLSPHDCRHAWATAATRAGTSVKALQDAGGWSSPAMPLRYAESAEIANEGVKLR